MGTTALIIAVSYLVLVAVGLAVAVVVARSTRARRREADTALLARREKAWLGVVIVLLAALLLATIFFAPYGASAPGEKQVVRVTASQFAWAIEPGVVRAGAPVEFQITSVDVNHGFGVYDGRDTLLFQVQVMPGRTQKAVHTFEEQGSYRVLCLEFCGFAHHLMTAQIEVTA